LIGVCAETFGLAFSRIQTNYTYYVLEYKIYEKNAKETQSSQNLNDYTQNSTGIFQTRHDDRNENKQAPGTSKSFPNYVKNQKGTKQIEVKDVRKFTVLPSQTPEIMTTNRRVFTKEEWEFFGYKTDLFEQQKQN
jgi:hypothetical protein